MALAVFDIDGTLVTGRSTERRFFQELLSRGLVSWRQVAAFTLFAGRCWPRYGWQVFKKDKAWLAGLEVAAVNAACERWVRQELPRHWFHPCLARLRAHQAEGDRVVLLSGTPDFIAGAIARVLGVEQAIGSRCATARGLFLARPALRHPFGEVKRDLLLALCREHGLDPADVVAYGDSGHDIPLLAIAGRAVAVRPDATLHRYARRAGWEILGDRRPLIGRIASLPAR